MSGRPVPYGGLATRAVALATDAAFAQGIVFAGGAVVALVASLVSEVHLGTAARILAGCVWFLVVGGYFVAFWSTAGQTPGMRLMGLRVVGPGGAPPSVLRSLVRVVGLAASIIPLFLGFLPVLVDDRRRGLHDLLARTVVLYDAEAMPSESAVAAAAHEPRRRDEVRAPEGLGMTRLGR